LHNGFVRAIQLPGSVTVGPDFKAACATHSGARSKLR
jgi:hypothetical protein